MGMTIFRDIEKLCVRPDETVRKAIKHIDDGQCGIVLVVDGERRLIGTITDGDIRRALLAHQDIDGRVDAFLAIKVNSALPVTAPVGTDPAVLLAWMTSQLFRQI